MISKFMRRESSLSGSEYTIFWEKAGAAIRKRAVVKRN
jgi:hypothetical protein